LHKNQTECVQRPVGPETIMQPQPTHTC